MMNKCNRCEQMKDVTEFYKSSLTCCARCVKEKVKLYRNANPDKLKQRKKEERQKHTEYYKQYGAAYYEANRTRIRQDQKERFIKNGKKWTQKQLQRRRDDPAVKIAHTLRTRTRNAFAGKSKACTTQELLGCTFEQAKAHIEKQFQPGMTWENYGHSTWHIDHIRPLKSFDLLDPEQQKQAFHYSNLQPLWAQDNLRKGAKLLDTPHPYC